MKSTPHHYKPNQFQQGVYIGISAQVFSYLIIFTLLLTASAMAQNPINITLSSPNIHVGEQATVEARVDCGSLRCTVFAVTLLFDPVIMRIDEFMLGDYLGEAYVAEDTIDNAAGEARFAAVALGTGHSPPTDLLFSFQITGLEAGSFQFGAARLEIGDVTPVSATLRGGAVVVQPPPLSIPTPQVPTDTPPPLTPPLQTSSIGQLANQRIVFTRNMELYSYDPATDREQLLVSTGQSFDPDIRGNWVIYTNARDRRPVDLFLYDLNTGIEHRLTDYPDQERHGAISPDGTRVAFTSDATRNWEIYILNFDGSNLINVTNSPSDDYFPTWTPDAQHLIFQSNVSGSNEYHEIDLATGQWRQITDSDIDLVGPVISPSGEWIAGYANVDIPYWILAHRITGELLSGTRGVASDWIDDETIIYHRRLTDDAAPSVFIRNPFTDDEVLLLESGQWAAVYP